MILTPAIIAEMRRYWRIDERLEHMLLEQLGTEPYPHIYTEQDIHEQSRKMINRYNESRAVTKNRSELSMATMPKTRRVKEEMPGEIL